jgi:O-antigen/teichoic acid export membrane protein
MAEGKDGEAPKKDGGGKDGGGRSEEEIAASLRRKRHFQGKKLDHSHPGGTGSVLGTRLARFSSFQGLSLLVTNVLHFASIPVVARFLGPKPLGAYALLFFLTGLITQIIHLVSKPGTMMRTFGVADDDDDDVEDDDEDKSEEPVSTRPAYTLGVGIIWCTFLSLSVIGIVFVFRSQIAQFLLHDPGQADAVVFATITGALWAIFKLGEMVYWFESRPLAYAIVDATRPLFNLIAIVTILSMGAGIKGAVIGQAIGTTLATVLCIFFLRKSFQLGFSFRELAEILKRGAIRIPIASSMWTVQNADSFILSRFLDHKSIGLYNLASRTGFMVAFLPQGFRMALRPLRKTAVYRAYRQEYGIAVAQGQLLAYFILITLTAVLAMVLGGEILITIGGPRFKSAAPIIPLTALAMSMPALYRTVSSMSVYPNKRTTFILSTILVAIIYVGLMIMLLGHTGIGIYTAPISLLIAFIIPCVFMFLRSQLGEEPIEFPYLAMLQATGLAVAIAVIYHFVKPDDKWIQLALITPVMLFWFASLFVLRIIPKYHWHPIRHIAFSAFRGSALRFDPGAGLGSLKPRERRALRAAVLDRMPAQELVSLTGDGADGGDRGGEGDLGEWMISGDRNRDDAAEGARLVRLLRQAGQRGGVPVSETSEVDAGISLFLFSDQPVAVRLAKMRELLSAGSNPHELRTLEDIRDALVKAPDDAWGTGKGGGKKGARKKGGGKSGGGRKRAGSDGRQDEGANGAGSPAGGAKGPTSERA